MERSRASADRVEQDVEALRAHTHAFVRAFGLLASGRTPCGKPMSVSYAHALMVLHEAHARGDRPTQQALGRALAIDKSNVARLCAKMVAAGHLRQTPAPGDGRSRLLSLTSRGRRLATEVDASSRRRFATLLARMPSSRRADVLGALDLLAAATVSMSTEISE